MSEQRLPLLHYIYCYTDGISQTGGQADSGLGASCRGEVVPLGAASADLAHARGESQRGAGCAHKYGRAGGQIYR